MKIKLTGLLMIAAVALVGCGESKEEKEKRIKAAMAWREQSEKNKEQFKDVDFGKSLEK